MTDQEIKRERVAIEAAIQIRDAIGDINKDSGKVMVLLPYKLVILDNGNEYIFNFADLIRNVRPEKEVVAAP